MNIDQQIAKQFCQPPREGQLFSVGQTVRVIKYIECNMPSELDYWLNTECEVLKIVPRGFISREWAYELKHPNGKRCEFKIDELDRRYIKKVNKVAGNE